MAKQFKDCRFVQTSEGIGLPMPCQFLYKSDSIKKHKCKIYAERPLACVLFPFQFGGHGQNDMRVLAVSSSCPEGRRIAKRVCMATWILKHKFGLIMEDSSK